MPQKNRMRIRWLSKLRKPRVLDLIICTSEFKPYITGLVAGVTAMYKMDASSGKIGKTIAKPG